MSRLSRILKISKLSHRFYITNASSIMSKNKKGASKQPVSVSVGFFLHNSIIKINLKKLVSKLIKEAAAAAANNVDNSEKAIFLNKSGEICLSIQAKPGSKDTAIAGKF